MNGLKRCSESDLYYYRARYYDAGLGRFISEDPKGFGGDSLNLYGYVANNPIVYIDPHGNSLILAMVGLAKAALLPATMIAFIAIETGRIIRTEMALIALHKRIDGKVNDSLSIYDELSGLNAQCDADRIRFLRRRLDVNNATIQKANELVDETVNEYLDNLYWNLAKRTLLKGIGPKAGFIGKMIKYAKKYFESLED